MVNDQSVHVLAAPDLASSRTSGSWCRKRESDSDAVNDLEEGARKFVAACSGTLIEWPADSRTQPILTRR